MSGRGAAERRRQRKAALGDPLLRFGYTVWRKVRDRIATDAKWRCTYCGRRVRVRARDWNGDDLATIDHLTPLCRGGTWKRYNLGCACKACNQDKGSMTESEYRPLVIVGLRARGLKWHAKAIRQR